MDVPPLLGDGHGRYRVKVVGNSGSGKTTLSKSLAAVLDVPYISMDALFWKPGWEATPTDELCLKVRKALDQDVKGWVVDGDYQRRTGGIIEQEATDIVWLDPPLLLYFPRLCYRTILRLLGLRATCSPGCPESLRSVLSKDSIIWWCLSHHWTVRKKNFAIMSEVGRADGAGDGKMRRIGGWGSELRLWWSEVEKLVH